MKLFNPLIKNGNISLKSSANLSLVAKSVPLINYEKAMMKFPKHTKALPE